MSNLIISLLILTLYVVIYTIRWGLPKSISQTYFNLSNKWIFTIVLWLSFGLMLIPVLNILPENCKIFGFLFCASGFIIGASPNLNDDFEEKVHMTGAVLLGATSQLIVAMLYYKLLIMWLTMLPLVLLYKKPLLWSELVGGAILYTCLFKLI